MSDEGLNLVEKLKEKLGDNFLNKELMPYIEFNEFQEIQKDLAYNFRMSLDENIEKEREKVLENQNKFKNHKLFPILKELRILQKKINTLIDDNNTKFRALPYISEEDNKKNRFNHDTLFELNMKVYHDQDTIISKIQKDLMINEDGFFLVEMNDEEKLKKLQNDIKDLKKKIKNAQK